MVSQLASSLFDIPVASIVRRGTKTEEEYADMVDHMKRIGKNSIVAAEDLLSDPVSMNRFLDELRNLSSTGKLPKLALNAVGGDSAKLLLKSIRPGGSMVTYGGMSMKPITVPTSQLIFKDVNIVGYWHSRWMVNALQNEKQSMIDELVDAVLKYNIHCPNVQLFPLKQEQQNDNNNIQEALQWHANQSIVNGQRSKLIWDCKEY